MTERTGRMYGIDLLRGVACGAVVGFHYLSRGPRAGWMAEAPWRSLESIAQYGYLGVHLFFIVSGYVIFMSAVGRSPREFVASRVARLYPALWAAASLTMLAVVLRGDSRFLVSWTDYFWNLTLIPQYVRAAFVDGAYWSLAVELQFYIFVWIILRTRLLARVEMLLGGWLLVAVVDAARPMDPVERWLIANWAPLFIFGAATFLVASAGWTKERAALLIFSLLTALWHAHREAGRLAGIWEGVGPSPTVVIPVLTSAAALFLVVGTGRIVVGKSAAVTFAGTMTYPLYLIHQVAGYMMYSWIVDLGGQPSLALAGTVFAALLVAVGIHALVEKPLGPALRLFIGGVQRSSAKVSPP